MRPFGILLLLLSLCGVAQTQEEAWQAWLYESDTARIWRIGGSGEILTQATLPLMTPGVGRAVRVSPGGTRMVYVSYVDSREVLIVYDAEGGEILLQYPLPPVWAETIEFNTYYAQFFSADESHLAFSYTISHAGGWEILIFDLASGDVTHTLRSGEGIAADLPTISSNMIFGPVLPIIRDFDGRFVAFTMREPDATGRVWESYRWDIEKNQIIFAPAYAVLEMDVYRPTGEIVQTVRDPNTHEPHMALYAAASDTEPEVIFNSDPEFPADEPVFIQNGTAIVYKSYMNAPGWALYILRRGGSEAELWSPSTTRLAYDIHGTATGFIYTHPTINANGDDLITVYEVNTVNGLGEAAVVFTLPVESGYNSRLIWVGDPRLTVPVP